MFGIRWDQVDWVLVGIMLILVVLVARSFSSNDYL